MIWGASPQSRSDRQKDLPYIPDYISSLFVYFLRPHIINSSNSSNISNLIDEVEIVTHEDQSAEMICISSRSTTEGHFEALSDGVRCGLSLVASVLTLCVVELAIVCSSW
ncbi:hypothetical protein F2Q70_00021182 [Brassica cretica]|uniref:Uncharacterized protein n=1 Tax=Brassica cretica TaxID=69181 RepID=A0A8S9GV05_BRACR|nr:hypothetical protein F2Q70_00021182 [Brassica cretica]KAF2557229.1 hypothetical protein F2Q68_00014643 [Brassica cretica]